jgi:tripartite ATP-independent transporter DctP family solute receptor
MQIFLLVIVASLVNIGFLFAGGATDTKPAEKKILKISYTMAPTDIIHEVMTDVAKTVNEKAKDELEVQLFPSGQLGNATEGLEAIRLGANILVHADPSNLGDYVKDAPAMYYPFLYKDHNDVFKLVKSDFGKEILAKCEAQQLKFVNMNWFWGFRHSISNRPVKTPADTAQLKFRIAQQKLMIEFIKAIGANPTQMNLGEIYSALQTGVIDACEMPLGTMYSLKLHEVAKNVALTGHMASYMGWVMNTDYFNSFSKETQKILVDALEEGGNVCTQRFIDAEEDFRKKMEEAGAKFTDVDHDAFVKSCANVYTQFPEWTPGIIDRIQAELAK